MFTRFSLTKTIQLLGYPYDYGKPHMIPYVYNLLATVGGAALKMFPTFESEDKAPDGDLPMGHSTDASARCRGFVDTPTLEK